MVFLMMHMLLQVLLHLLNLLHESVFGVDGRVETGRSRAEIGLLGRVVTHLVRVEMGAWHHRAAEHVRVHRVHSHGHCRVRVRARDEWTRVEAVCCPGSAVSVLVTVVVVVAAVSMVM